MKSIILAALGNEQPGDDCPDQVSDKNSRIAVIGCGSAGCHTVSRLKRIGISGAQTIAIDSDLSKLKRCCADTRLFIGKSLTKGLGAGGYPNVGRKAALSAEKTLGEMLDGFDLVFLTTGLGGGVGTGASPVVARIAREKGARVIVFAGIPFKNEWSGMFDPVPHIQRLLDTTDSLILVDNAQVHKFVPNLPYGQIFRITGQAICEAVGECIIIANSSCLFPVDISAIKGLSGKSGLFSLFVGEGKTGAPAEKLVENCLEQALLDVDYHDARSGLVHMSGGPDLTIQRVEEISAEFTSRFSPSVDIVFSARNNPELEDKIKIMAIMGGFAWKGW